MLFYLFFSDLFIYLLFLVALGLITFLKNIYLLFKHWIFIVLLHGLSLVSASWATLWLKCAGFSLW